MHGDPLFFVFNISLSCRNSEASYIGNLWRVLLLGNHLKQRRRRRRGQRIVKDEFIFYLRISQLSWSFQCAYWSPNLLKLSNCMTPAFNSKWRHKNLAAVVLACVTDETKPRYCPSLPANRLPARSEKDSASERVGICPRLHSAISNGSLFAG